MMIISDVNWMQVGAWLAHDDRTVPQTHMPVEQGRD